MICEKCGGEVKPGAAFCTVCGAKVDQSKTQESVNVTGYSKGLNSKIKKWIPYGILAAVVLLIVVVVVATRKPHIKPNDYVSVSFSGYGSL